MEDLSLHILDIVENSIAASAKKIEIKINEDQDKDLLTIEVSDDGNGMDEQTLKKALDPFFTTRTTRRVGLGLSLLAQAAGDSDGTFDLISQPGKGTTVRATFRLSHPDCKPMGNVEETLRVLATTPGVDFVYEYRKNDSVHRFDTRDLDRK
ncbi:MAG: ATP-binding protein [Planctomycetota bacterium]|jgi:signal transduction histidine kinase